MHMDDNRSLRFAGGPQGFLLIHGLGGTPVEMRYIARGLARAGHTVHVPQLAGHCGTVEELKATTWQHWYESVEQEHSSSARKLYHDRRGRPFDGRDPGAPSRSPASAGPTIVNLVPRSNAADHASAELMRPWVLSSPGTAFTGSDSKASCDGLHLCT